MPGYWEGGLIIGSTASGCATGTVVERMTRFVRVLRLPTTTPHSSSQRGTNEHTNGPLRQFLLKAKTYPCFRPTTATMSPPNSTDGPGRTLGFKTPAETLDELLSNPFNPPAGASST